MSALGWAGMGALSMLGSLLVLGVYVLFVFNRHPQFAFESLAAFTRVIVNATGFQSVVVSRDPETQVVAFEALARALEQGDVRTHAPVSVHRSEPPPPRPNPSGGYDERH